jgi:hypothetical protein
MVGGPSEDAAARCVASSLARRFPGAEPQPPPPGPEDGLEATPEHALAIERHLRRVHRFLELRVVHDRLADALAVRLVLVDDPRQRNHFAVLELHGLGKRRELARLRVVTDRVGVIQRTLTHVRVAPFRGHALVRVEVGTGYRDDEGVDIVRHGTSWLGKDTLDRSGPRPFRRTAMPVIACEPRRYNDTGTRALCTKRFTDAVHTESMRHY